MCIIYAIIVILSCMLIYDIHNAKQACIIQNTQSIRWINPNAIDTMKHLQSIYGYPYIINGYPGGNAVWNSKSLRGTYWTNITVRDTYDKPTMVSIIFDLTSDPRDVTPDIIYSGSSHTLTIPCDHINDAIYTLYIVLMYDGQKINTSDALAMYKKNTPYGEDTILKYSYTISKILNDEGY